LKPSQSTINTLNFNGYFVKNFLDEIVLILIESFNFCSVTYEPILFNTKYNFLLLLIAPLTIENSELKVSLFFLKLV